MTWGGPTGDTAGDTARSWRDLVTCPPPAADDDIDEDGDQGDAAAAADPLSVKRRPLLLVVSFLKEPARCTSPDATCSAARTGIPGCVIWEG